MRTVDEYMKLPYRMEIVQDPDEGGYVVSFPELKGCLTCAITMEQAISNAEDAKREWFSAALEDGYSIPDPDSVQNYSGQFKLRMPKSLHRHLAQQAADEGISMNQYCIYLLSRNSAPTLTAKTPQ